MGNDYNGKIGIRHAFFSMDVNSDYVSSLGLPAGKYDGSPVNSLIVQGRPGELEVHIVNTMVIESGMQKGTGKVRWVYHQREDKECFDRIMERIQPEIDKGLRAQ